MKASPHLRIAHATGHLESAIRFYTEGVGFTVLGSFEGHAGFDGVMVGLDGAAYHLELTRKRGHPAGRAPNEDTQLVLYFPERPAWEAAVARMAAAGYEAMPAFNPYWEVTGHTFEDPYAYRVVLQRGGWPETGDTPTIDAE